MMMNAEAISHELVAAGLSAKAAEVIAKNLANGAEYQVSAADFADFKTVTRDDIKQINAKLDKIREEVFAQKEHTTATSTSLREEIAATKTSLQQEIAAVKTSLQQEIAAVKTSLQQEIAALSERMGKLEGQNKMIIAMGKIMMAMMVALVAMVGSAALAVIFN